MMTEKYCLRGDVKKHEVEIWNLKVKGTNVVSYNQRFQELALMCARMFPEESDKIEKYVGGLPDMIHRSVMASKPKTMQDAIKFATELMDKKISTFAERQAENKRKFDNNNQAQQQPPKKQGVAIAYTARSGERKEYARTLPLCNKYKFHHNSQCTVKTYRSDCPELKNQNHANAYNTKGFIAPSFLPTDDHMASLNKAMMFLSTTMNSRFPPTNNQFRTLSNPRTQAIIQDGRVTVQNVQGRQSQCNTPKMGRSGIRIRGMLLQDQQHKIYIRTTQKSFRLIHWI
ncbi:hypothetical protein Tco_1420034 [Tanacetum coccineum]